MEEEQEGSKQNNNGGINMSKCGAQTEVYSRVCGYFRPVTNWNKGKKEEFKDRMHFAVAKNHASKQAVA